MHSRHVNFPVISLVNIANPPDNARFPPQWREPEKLQLNQWSQVTKFIELW